MVVAMVQRKILVRSTKGRVVLALSWLEGNVGETMAGEVLGLPIWDLLVWVSNGQSACIYYSCVVLH